MKGRFIGDPAHEYEHIEIQKIGEGEDATEEESTVSRLKFIILKAKENPAGIQCVQCSEFGLLSHFYPHFIT